MGWRIHPICKPCWAEQRHPAPVAGAFNPLAHATCCWCGRTIWDRVYVRKQGTPPACGCQRAGVAGGASAR